MNRPLSDKIKGKPRILVAPLDWGLGHATRCIPIIKELINQGCDVWLAGEGAQEDLLNKEFPSLPFLPLKGYRIKYAKTRRGLIWKMLAQAPKFKRAIKYENKWLKKIIAENSIDAVISDNRYGLYHATIPSIIITHQLAIKTGFAKWTEKILQKRNYRFLNKFTLCWVPDFSGNTNLAGELSHPTTLPAIPVHYIGLLSRLAQKEVNEIEKHLLVLISGPEPQRSMLEERVIEQICHYNGTATVLRGLPGSSNLAPSTGMLKFHNHLSAEELSHEMKKAAYVISRSGYSTIMDIATMNKKSILIPTPGQTEQEYLGRYLMGKKMAVTVPQNEFSLSVALQTAYNFDYADFEILANNLLKEAISHFLHQSFSADFG